MYYKTRMKVHLERGKGGSEVQRNGKGAGRTATGSVREPAIRYTGIWLQCPPPVPLRPRREFPRVPRLTYLLASP